MSHIVKSPDVGVGNELSFALYGAANRMVRLHKPFLEPLGLTFPQYLVLLELFAATPRTVGDLCAKLSMDKESQWDLFPARQCLDCRLGTSE